MRGAEGVGSRPAHQLQIFHSHRLGKAASENGEALMVAEAPQLDGLAIEQQSATIYRNGTYPSVAAIGIYGLATVFQLHGGLIQIGVLRRPKLNVRDLHLYRGSVACEGERFADGLPVLISQAYAATFSCTRLLHLERDRTIELGGYGNIRKTALSWDGIKYNITMQTSVRKEIVIDLDKAGLVEKIEDYDNKVGYSERTKVVIEPKLSMQWFLKMDKITIPALNAVMDDDIKFYPPKFKNTYRHWMTNIKDWCISRQLWWGHRIPAYFLPEGGYVVAETDEQAVELAKEKTGNKDLTINDLRRDEDCLDTWFSSWLWPISLFNGILDPNNEEINYYYPTNDLVTGPDIIFFWVARMIISGYEYINDKPFNSVYFTGIVRDKLGRKMSKSLGNSPDPLDLIATYGADGVRMGMMLAAPAGNDILYDDKLCEQGRNFCNKIWNAFRLVKGWEIADEEQPEYAKRAVAWFDEKLSATQTEVKDLFSKFRLSEALMEVYKLFWDEFSSWYLEMVKPAYGKPIDAITYKATLNYFDSLLRLLHPFMPFITEELWQHLEERKEGDSIMTSLISSPKSINSAILDSMEKAKEIIIGVRSVRASKNIANKEVLTLNVLGDYVECEQTIITKLANLDSINIVTDKDASAASFMVGTTEFNVPLANNIDIEAELEKLNKDLEYQLGFLASVQKKLSNERFVNNAPAAVVEGERKKLADAESKIATIKESIAALSK